MSRLKERIENFNKAFSIYKDAVAEYDENVVLSHMALIQSYEVCFELAWKTIKDYLNAQGVEVYLPKEVIKEAFAGEVIKEGQLWIDMLNARNSTSHEYNMDKINKFLEKISTIFFDELSAFKTATEGFHE